MNEIMTQLRQPFHPSQVDWKPGATTKDGARCMAIAYADLRAYQNRLDEVCGMDWSVSYTPWGDRIICNLTIAGVTRSSTGEGDSQSERSEIAGTAAEAQAFKRACAMFGLGRYLYTLPSVWVEYDKETRRISDQGRAKLEAIIASHFRQAGQITGHRQEGADPVVTDRAAELRTEFDELGDQLYGTQWAQVRAHNIERISAGQATDPAQLSAEAISRLVDGLKTLQRNRADKRAAA